MKKAILLISILLLVLPISIFAKEENEQVGLYVFYGENCDYCKNLHSFLDELKNDDEYNYMYKLIDLEVWHDEDNSNLMVNVADYFGFKLKGVPFIVVGEDYITGFNKEKDPDNIKKMIKNAYENKNYVDVVAKVDDGTLKAKQDAEEASKVEATKNQSKRIGLILTGIVAIIIVAIIFGRTGEAYLEENSLEEVKIVEDKKETKKTTAKKNTTKKNTSNKKKTKK